MIVGEIQSFPPSLCANQHAAYTVHALTHVHAVNIYQNTCTNTFHLRPQSRGKLPRANNLHI